MRILKLTIPLAVLALSVALFGALNGRSGAPGSQRRAILVAVPPGAATDTRIAALQSNVRAGGRGLQMYAALGDAYLQKVRETGDFGYYVRAGEAYRRALARDPRDEQAVVGLGTLALARHDFRTGLRYGRRAEALAPQSAVPLPVVVDALVELGRYPEARRALQELVDRRPGLAAYARISYFRELQGDIRGAVTAMRLAVDAGSATPEGTAYVQTLLGTLERNRGRFGAARAAYGDALRAQPGFPAANAGLARVDAARGHLGAAITRLRQVVERLPLPEYAIALGETELAAGMVRQGRDDLALVDAERRLLGASGINTDSEFAIFQADHGNPSVAVRLARKAFAAAPSVRSADALGWALTRDGDPVAGAAWCARALRRGWKDPLALYHAGMSAAQAHQRGRAHRLLGELLAQSPGFSPLDAPRARRALAALR